MKLTSKPPEAIKLNNLIQALKRKSGYCVTALHAAFESLIFIPGFAPN